MASINLRKLIQVGAAAAAAASAAAADPRTSTTTGDVPVIQAQVEKEVGQRVADAEKDVNAILENVANREPWYQSRVIIGTGVSILLQVAKLAGKEIDPTLVDPLVQVVMDLLTVGAAALALYGRVATVKPLGS